MFCRLPVYASLYHYLCQLSHNSNMSNNIWSNHGNIICQACDYETLEVHRLESHRVTSHSNTRPYVCEWCGKDFKLLGSLTLHTNTHTRARRFQCPLCDKVFSQHGARKVSWHGTGQCKWLELRLPCLSMLYPAETSGLVLRFFT